MFTPDEVSGASFRQGPLFGDRGYDVDQVDALLDLLEKHARDPRTSDLTLAQIESIPLRRTRFGSRGYRVADVDAFLRHIAARWNR